MSTETLLRIFGIQQEDLETNRQGKLSERQRLIIRSSTGCNQTVLLLFVVVWCVVFGALIFLGIANNPENKVSWNDVIIPICSISIAPLIGIFALYLIHRSNNATDVHSRSGVLKYYSLYRRGIGYRYGIEIDGLQFPLKSSQIQSAFIEGSVYTIYYVKPILKVVSAELISRKSKIE